MKYVMILNDPPYGTEPATLSPSEHIPHSLSSYRRFFGPGFFMGLTIDRG